MLEVGGLPKDSYVNSRLNSLKGVTEGSIWGA